MTLRAILIGLGTYVPGAARVLAGRTGGTISARYCYSVWLRHLRLAHDNGLCAASPAVVAELGPGDSMGIGLAALLSGSRQYYGFDVIKHTSAARNLRVLDGLVPLFRRKEPIPGASELPEVKPYLDSYDFPADLITDSVLAAALADDRLERVRRSVTDTEGEGSLVRYKAPWFDASVVQPGSVDMIYSQAVLEHVEDLPATYRAMAQWLKPGGFVSHQIDYRCHRTARAWNGHWGHSDFLWGVMRGRLPYLLNREPHSTHVRLMEEAGLKVVYEKRVESPSTLARERLAPRFRGLSETDLCTSGAFIQAVKRDG